MGIYFDSHIIIHSIKNYRHHMVLFPDIGIIYRTTGPVSKVWIRMYNHNGWSIYHPWTIERACCMDVNESNYCGRIWVCALVGYSIVQNF